MEKRDEVEWPHEPTALTEDALSYIIDLMQRQGLHTVLELGGGVGVSATRLAESGFDVTTVERDEAYSGAIADRAMTCGVKERVHVVCADALDTSLCIDGHFDIILIDAAKAQYTRLFRRWCKQLSPVGFIISDNMAFHGITQDPSLSNNRSTKQLAKHLREYDQFLRWHPDFATHYIDVGDGLVVSERKRDFAPILCKKEPLFEATGGIYYALEYDGIQCAIKVLPKRVIESQMRRQAQLLATLHEEHINAICPICCARVGECFAIILTPPPTMTVRFAFNQVEDYDAFYMLITNIQLRQLHLSCAKFDIKLSYKTVLRREAGGDSIETAQIIRAIKQLPASRDPAILCNTLDDLIVLESGQVDYAGDGILCCAPFEFVMSNTVNHLRRGVSKYADELYLDMMGVYTFQLASFITVLRMLPDSSPLHF